MPELASVNISSGVSIFTGEAFCEIVATDTEGGRMRGQLDPKEVRLMASDWMLAAAAAEYDALVVNLLTEEVGMDSEHALTFLVALRKRRETLEGKKDLQGDS